MSIFYKKTSSESTKNLYRKSLVYRLDISRGPYDNLKNFNAAEKYLYGRVNRAYVPIEIDTDFVSLKGLPQTNKTDANGYQAINFVADAFNELCMQFRVKLQAGKIDAKDPFLSVLNANKAYQSPRTLYRFFSIGNKKTIRNSFDDKNIKFKDFKEFLVHLEAVLEELTSLVPFTYPAFVKSKHCSMESTGLVIDIAAESCSNDENKIRKFKESPNWEFYLNACRSYGFSVDQYVPWRLIADIGTPEMVTYAGRYGMNSTDQILTTAYRPAHVTYYENFKFVLLELYNETKSDYVVVDYCLDGTTRSKVVKPTQYTLAEMSQEFNEILFMSLYTRIRLMEERESALSDHQKRNLLREAAELLRSEEPLTVVNYFEHVIAPTYDTAGSLTDLLHRARIRKGERENVLSNT